MYIHLKNVKNLEESIWLTKIIYDYQKQNFHPNRYRDASSIVYSNDSKQLACCVYRNKKSIVGIMIKY